MTTIQKNEIKDLVLAEYERLGNLKSVGNRCGVSEATISQIVNDKWEQIASKMWLRIGQALGWVAAGWQVVETTNTRLLTQVFEDAKEYSLFMAVAHKAGSGKTESSRNYAAAYARQGAYFMQAREWSRRQFIDAMCRTLGISTGPGEATTEGLIALVVEFFSQRSHIKPLLIIDEADKLKADALRAIIPLYNELENRIGLVILGTDNLQRQIEIGVQWNKKGYDELHSRFGRSFVHLYGATRSDVRAICEANGVTDAKLIDEIWREANPSQVNIGGQFVHMVDDLRRVRRAVTREVIKSIHHNGNNDATADDLG